MMHQGEAVMDLSAEEKQDIKSGRYPGKIQCDQH